MRGARSVRATGVLLALLASSVRLDAATSIVVAPEWRSWRYDTYRGHVEVEQSLLPVDVSWRSSRVELGGGFDLLRGREDDAEGGARVGAPTAIRFSAQAPWANGAVVGSLRHEVSLAEGELDAEEVLVAEAFEPLALEFARPRPFAGSATSAGLAAQVARGPQWTWTAAAAGEWRGDADLTDAGPRFGAGPRWRVATALELERGLLRTRIAVRAGGHGWAELDGERAYRLGQEVGLTLSSDLLRGADALHGRLDAAWVARGEVAPTLEATNVLPESAVRGGNRLALSAAWSRVVRTLTLTGGVEARILRGFDGDLGHSGWIAPRIAVGRRLGAISARVEIERAVGGSRGGRSLEGAVLRLVLVHGGAS